MTTETPEKTGAQTAPVDLHDLDASTFHSEVHSFEFWFQTIEGYLGNNPYGFNPHTDEEELSDQRREGLITILCNYCIGESAALEGSSGMISFAPDYHSKIFLSTQVADEGRHLEILIHRLRMLGVIDPIKEISHRSNLHLNRFKERLLDYVDSHDWEAAVFAQNVVLEAMEFAVFQSHLNTADSITRQMLSGIVKDERRHMGFGENDLGRRIQQQPHIKKRLDKIKKDLDKMIFSVFDDVLDSLEIPSVEKPDLKHKYLGAVHRLGFTV